MNKKNNSDSTSVLYSTMSISIVLFLLGAYGVVFLHAANISKLIKEKINIIIELQDGITDKELNDLEKSLSLREGIKSGSIVYISKEEAFVIMEDYFQDISTNDQSIPFRDVITFNIESEFFDDSFLSELSSDLIKDKSVLNVYRENDTINMVKENVKKVSFISLFIGAIFILLSLVIIYNTLRLKLFADRMEIKTMQLVGAKRGFIAKPYIREAFVIGLQSFLFAVLMLGICIVLIYINIPEVGEILNFVYLGIILVIMFLISIIITVGVARQVVRSYLDSSKAELI